MRIIVYGTGCRKCGEVEEVVRRAITAAGSAATVEKVGDLAEMLAAGVMMTPAVSVDGVVKSAGRIPREEEVRTWLGEGRP
jgi:small redox-active disulfide protein 2